MASPVVFLLSSLLLLLRLLSFLSKERCKKKEEELGRRISQKVNWRLAFVVFQLAGVIFVSFSVLSPDTRGHPSCMPAWPPALDLFLSVGFLSISRKKRKRKSAFPLLLRPYCFLLLGLSLSRLVIGETRKKGSLSP